MAWNDMTRMRLPLLTTTRDETSTVCKGGEIRGRCQAERAYAIGAHLYIATNEIQYDLEGPFSGCLLQWR